MDDYDYDENLSISYRFNGAVLHCNDCNNDSEENYEDQIDNDYMAHMDIYCP